MVFQRPEGEGSAAPSPKAGKNRIKIKTTRQIDSLICTVKLGDRGFLDLSPSYQLAPRFSTHSKKPLRRDTEGGPWRLMRGFCRTSVNEFDDAVASREGGENLLGHQLQGAAHVRHRHTAEVDHGDHVGDAGLFIVSKYFLCSFRSREYAQSCSFHFAEYRHFGSRTAMSFRERSHAVEKGLAEARGFTVALMQIDVQGDHDLRRAFVTGLGIRFQVEIVLGFQVGEIVRAREGNAHH